ncbi:MAG TPA: hypothetical protein PKE27_00995 [Povalibacter sp.]|nr:hypothetical protein [Povalibacter sp.]
MNADELTPEQREGAVITLSVMVIVLNLLARYNLTPKGEANSNIGPVLLSLIGAVLSNSFYWVTQLFISLPHMMDRPRVPSEV